ncbi:MAG: serine/threonine protein kinase, partial [Myxococcales bacterium]|nr:serine/threonine protein kinase [Myxococcales bacterium]
MADTPSSSSHAGMPPPPLAPPGHLAPAATYSELDPSRSFAEAPEDDLVGATLSNTYTVVRVVGEGGMGRVYEAKHTRIKSKRFAIKTLHPEFARSAEVLQRFYREVEAASSIQSPHVVGVYDVDKTPDGRPFFVAEYLEGSDLGALLDKTGKLGVASAVYIARQVCKALAAAHARGVVHRDIKPDNIFLTGDPQQPLVKVVDFGISRIEEGEGGSNLTKTGIIMGTPSFMSPEQARGVRSDQRTDVYALGAVLYACLTGTEPFDKGDASSTVVAVLTEEPPRPRDIEPSIPEHLEAIVQRAMAKDPAERYQSMVELDDALAPYDTGDGPALGMPAATGPSGARAAGRATRAGSMAELAGEAREIKLARPMLVLSLAGTALFAIGGLVSAIGGAIRLSRGGGELTGTETALVLVAVTCLALTPAILGIRHIQKALWGNSVKVLELLRGVRGPLLVGAFAYGLAALFVRLFEAVFLHGAARISWPAWDIVLFVVGAAGALGTRLALRLERIDVKAGRSVGATTKLAWAGLALLLTALFAVLAMRSGSAGSAATDPAAPAAGSGQPGAPAAGAPSTPPGAGSPAAG